METTAETIGLNENMITAALEYLRLGYKPIAVVPGTKAAAVKWKAYQTEMPTEADIREWFAGGKPNIALVTGNGLVVVDVDDPALLNDVIAHCGDTPMKCQTPSGGVHLYFRMRQGVHYGNAVKIRNRPIDLRCEGAYAICPWSRTEQGKYQWLGEVLPVSELPLVRVSWLRERKPKRMIQPVEIVGNIETTMRRARAYLSCIEGSISGNGGHRQAMRAAGVLVQKFGLSLEQAYPLMQEWNQKTCEPLWSEKEIIHKLQEAVRLRFEKGLKPING